MADGLGPAFWILRLAMWFGDGEASCAFLTTTVWSDSWFRVSVRLPRFLLLLQNFPAATRTSPITFGIN